MIDLIVDEAADVEAARLLYRSIYAGARALQSAPQGLLFAVLRLADRFQVQHSAKAAAAALAALQPAQLE